MNACRLYCFLSFTKVNICPKFPKVAGKLDNQKSIVGLFSLLGLYTLLIFFKSAHSLFNVVQAKALKRQKIINAKF